MIQYNVRYKLYIWIIYTCVMLVWVFRFVLAHYSFDIADREVIDFLIDFLGFVN